MTPDGYIPKHALYDPLSGSSASSTSAEQTPMVATLCAEFGDGLPEAQATPEEPKAENAQHLGALAQKTAIEYAADNTAMPRAAQPLSPPKIFVSKHRSAERTPALFGKAYLRLVRRAWQQAEPESQASIEVEPFPAIADLVDRFFADNVDAIRTNAGRQPATNKLTEHFTHNLMGVIAQPSADSELVDIDPPTPFMQLRPDEQRAVVNAFGAEWQDLVTLMRQYDGPTLPTLLQNIKKQGRPLAILSVGDLQNDLPEAGSGALDICKAFLKRPHIFTKEAESIRKAATFADQLTAYQEEYADTLSILPTHLKVQSAAESKRLLEAIAALPYINQDAARLALGQSLALSTLNEPLSPAYFNTLVDGHIELIGRSLYASMVGKQIRGVTTTGWQGLCIGSLMHENAVGSLRNLIITRLPSAIKAPKGSPKDSKLSFEDQPNVKYARLRLQAELVSTGRSPQAVSLEMNLVARVSGTPTQWDSIHKESEGIRCTTSQVLQRMREEAQLFATRGIARIAQQEIDAARQQAPLDQSFY